MIDVILIDDEIWICKLIRSIIDFASLGFNIVAEANDGITALELIKKFRPKLVITDIRMPGMDGLNLVKAARDLPFRTEFIIVSGYSDFEYARSALKYSAFGYLLKPLDRDSLSDLLLSVKEKIEKDSVYDCRIESSRIILQKESIRNLMMKSGEPEKITTNQSLYQENGLNFREGLFQVVIFQLDLEPGEQIIGFLKAALPLINKIVDEKLENFCIESSTLDFHKMKAVVAVLNYDKSKKSEVDPLLNSILDIYLRNIRFSKFCKMTIGAGCPVDDINRIDTSYTSALNGIKARINDGKQTVIHYTDNEIDKKSIISIEDEKKMKRVVELFDNPEFDQIVNEIFAKDTKLNLQKPLLLFQAAYDIADLITNTFRRKDICNHDGIDRNEIYENINSCSTVLEITGYLKSLFQKYSDIFESEKTLNSGGKIINILKKNISDNYMKDITLTDAAKLVCLNPNYLSELFKKETGENFSEYLTDYRICIAKGLLKEVQYRLIDVAVSVGYSDPKYFSRVFKKRVGINPTEYKKMYS